MPYEPTFEERQRLRWFNPALDRWATYERNRVLPPHLRTVIEPDDGRAWNHKRAAEAEAEEAEKARAELIAEIEEARAHARRALAELKADRAENRRLADNGLARMGHLLAEWRKLAAKAGFSPDQPRVPAGNPDGGQWTSGAGGTNGGTNGGVNDVLAGVDADSETLANDFDLGALFSDASALGEAQDFDSSPARVAELADAGDPPVLSDALPDSIFPPGAIVAQSDSTGRPIDLFEERALGGHTIEGHVAKSPEFLLNRLRRDAATLSRVADFSNGLRIGSFSSVEAASRLVNATVAKNQDKVDLVRSGVSPRETLEAEFGAPTGSEAFAATERSQPIMRQTTGVRVIIVRDRRAQKGFRVDTAFPVNLKR